MAGYFTIPLRDICESVEYGYTASASTEPVGPRFLRITDIVPERLDWEVVPFCQIDPKKLSKYRLHSGDIVIARTGATTGWAKFIKNPPEAVFASYLVRVRPAASVDARFVGFVVESSAYKDFIQQHMGGAAQPNANAQILTTYEIPLPPLSIQRRIAGILSAYDELIENNQRRIRILETMARALYREWFIEFRFPGHEKLPRVVSPLGDIPQGWEVKTVADSFEISGGGTPSRKESSYWDEGTVQWFAPSDLTVAGTMFMDDSPEHITTRGLAESSARLFPAFSVMMTSRATIGSIAINTHEACTNQGFITCLPNERVPLYFLLHWLTDTVPKFKLLASGATFKEISRGVFKTIEFLHPSPALVRRFESHVEPMAKQILALQRQATNLRRTRDLLLPRLLSGQVTLADAAA